MVRLGELDRTKPISYQRICSLSDEALELFPDLKLNDQEPEWCNWTPQELTKEAVGNEYGVKQFRKKLVCLSVADGLLKSEPESVKQGIEQAATHLTGGPLDKFIFQQAYNIRTNVELQKRIRPVMDVLIEAAFSNLRQYVKESSPEILDERFLNFFVYATTVGRLSPTLAPALRQDISKILGSRRKELTPTLFLTSLPALGYDSRQITEWDEQYVRLWCCDPGSPEGWLRGVNNAAYNAPPSLGWEFMKMHPRDADRFLRKHRGSFLRSLIMEMYRKCKRDPAVNAAWLAARFMKLHLTLHVLNGTHAYKRIPRNLGSKVLEIANTVRTGIRESTDNFEGKVKVEKIVGAVQWSLRER